MTSKKLSVEIDRLLKRVNEGNSLVCDIFTKLGSASNNVQKDKLESDLKKEIKKLQRFREQIKSWLSSNDVKDKTALEEAKSIIEEQMEKFKLSEKTHRIKAFSKEGLSQPDRLDPEMEEREKLIEWISEMLKELELQCDTFEGELESLKASLKKNKHGDTLKLKKMAKMASQIERHRWHIYTLENIHRLLSNEELEVESVKAIMNDVSHYVETNEEADTTREDGIYSSLCLNLTSKFKPNRIDSSPNLPLKEALQKSETKDQYHYLISEQGPSAQSVQPTDTNSPHSQDDLGWQDQQRPKSECRQDQDTKVSNVRLNATPPLEAQLSAQLGKPTSLTYADASTQQKCSPTVALGVQKQPASGSQLKTPRGQKPSATQQEKKDPKQQHYAPQQPTHQKQKSFQQAISSKYTGHAPSQNAAHDSASYQQSLEAPNIQEKIRSAIGKHIENLTNLSTMTSRLSAIVYTLNSGAHLGPRRLQGDRKRCDYINQMVQTSFANFPEPTDTKCSDVYLPETPYPVPPYYPLSPLSVLFHPDMMAKFGVDILFFIFYHVKIPSVRRTAIKELQNNSWKYHMKLMKWFKRHGEPKAVTDEYEIADYMYFDYETSWCQLKKSDFTLEYACIYNPDA